MVKTNINCGIPLLEQKSTAELFFLYPPSEWGFKVGRIGASHGIRLKSSESINMTMSSTAFCLHHQNSPLFASFNHCWSNIRNMNQHKERGVTKSPASTVSIRFCHTHKKKDSVLSTWKNTALVQHGLYLAPWFLTIIFLTLCKYYKSKDLELQVKMRHGFYTNTWVNLNFLPSPV